MRYVLARKALIEYMFDLDKALIDGDEFKANLMIERLIALYANLDQEIEKAQSTEITKEIKVA